MLHKLAVIAGSIKLAIAIVSNDAPSIERVIILSAWAVPEAIMQEPEFKVESELHVLHTEMLELEHFCQFCTWHFLIDNLISLFTETELPRYKEVT